MATTDYELESIFSENHPHTSNAIQKLLMAMADVYNHRGKRSFFGHDKGLSMGKEQKLLVNGGCNIGRNNSFKKEILREKLKKLKLDHLVYEVE